MAKKRNEKYITITSRIRCKEYGGTKTEFFVDYSEVTPFHRELVSEKELLKTLGFDKALEFANKKAKELDATLMY